jgi:RNA polymerase sigma-70 factor (ECF subfamily)
MTGTLQPRMGAVEILSQEHGFLHGMAKCLCPNEAEAQDLAQDTCERALREWQTHVLPENPRAWLMRTMHNLFIDACRRRSRRPVHEALNEELTGMQVDAESEPPWETLTVADIVSALREIDPLYRRVYELYEFENRSYAEIAEILQVNTLTVGSRLHRARRQLREVLVRRKNGGLGQ